MSFFLLLVGTVVVWFTTEMYYVARRQQTISQRLWDLETKWPPLLFVAGVLAGHLFAH